jgi:hypothetical protein
VSAGRPWLLATPVAAIAVGAGVAHAHGVGVAAFGPNLAAAALGALVHVVVVRSSRRARGGGALIAAILLGSLSLTLISSGMDGVHRWLSFGPLRLHVFSAVAPWWLLAASSERSVVRRVGLACLLLAQIVHVAQPDAAQATALAAGTTAVTLGAAREAPAVRAFVAGTTTLLAALTWTRPDALAPIAHVEGIFALAASSGTWALLGAAASLLVASLPFVVAARSPLVRERDLGRGALAYLAGALAASLAGAFPVALLGAGAGPVLGWYAAISACAVAAEARPGGGASAS